MCVLVSLLPLLSRSDSTLPPSSLYSQVVLHAFASPHPQGSPELSLPYTEDQRQGLMPGLRAFVPYFADMTDQQVR